MSFDWNDYYTLAEDLRTSTLESCLRSSISRIYYSVYCQARNHLRDTGVNIPNTESIHRWVWNYYRQQSGRTFTGIGNNGDRLHSNRKRADYDDDIEKLDEVVIESFRFANNVLGYLNQLRY
jgi:uncharacterized protein (UPF0332 family)